MKIEGLSLSFVFLLFVSLSASGQERLPWEEYDKQINAQSTIEPKGTDLFGDQVNLYNTGLSFSLTDVSLPGNNDLPVELTRIFQVQSRVPGAPRDLPMGTWDLDLPRIEGVFAATGINSGWQSNRCSGSGQPPAVTVGDGTTYPANQYWHGTTAHMPYGGELILADQGAIEPNTHPKDEWRWMTSSFAYFKCLFSLQRGGPGEGFEAITPDGMRYKFDVMAQYFEARLQAPESSDSGPKDKEDARGEQETDDPVDEEIEDEQRLRPSPLQRKRIVLYASEVEDRFGNYVRYTFSNIFDQTRLTKISSSDGRQISLTYNLQGKVGSVSDGTRIWNYQYDSFGNLSAVVLPDNSQWTIAFNGLWDVEFNYDNEPGTFRTCDSDPIILGIQRGGTGTVTNPSGATGLFELQHVRHGRTNVPKYCINYQLSNDPQDQNDDFAVWPRSADVLGLWKKRLTGPGLLQMDWVYSHLSDRNWAQPENNPPSCQTLDCDQPVCVDDSCAGNSVTTVEGPDGEWVRYTFGNSYRYNEGKLITVERGTGETNVLRTETMTYELAQSSQPFPIPVGTSPNTRGNVFAAEYLAPMQKRVVTQHSTDFIYEVNQFDAMARPVNVNRKNSQGQDRNEVTTYHDNLAIWVMGQVDSVIMKGESNGQQMTVTAEANTFSQSLALPLVNRKFGKVVQHLAWDTFSGVSSGQLGTVMAASDGNGNTTSLSSWHRGIPQNIVYADNTTTSAIVNNDGTLASVIDENGSKTCYSYDAMGRLTQIIWPSETVLGICDSSAWNTTNQVFEQVSTSEYGIGPGHWRQTINTGNGYTVSYFDGLWRTLLTREYDSDDEIATQRFSRYSYDHEGRTVFASYPSETSNANQGVTTNYDAIGRVTGISEDSDLGVLNTTIEYLHDFGYHTRTTDPNGNFTKTYFQGFDEPDYEAVLLHDHPEGAATVIARNFLGEVDWMRRQDVVDSSRVAGSLEEFISGNFTIEATRSYVYNSHRELCKVIEPETGASVMAYDNSGNLSWRAEGLNLSDIGSCDLGSVAPSERISFDYDSRNRLINSEYPDDRANTLRYYRPDGSLERISTSDVIQAPPEIAGSEAKGSVLYYRYNNRGQLITETFARLEIDQLWITAELNYFHDRNGYLRREERFAHAWSYPANTFVDYDPNGLGQPTRLGGFATGVTYHPNGAIKGFTFGNGISHSVSQNIRNLPSQIEHRFGFTSYLDETYYYDGNGNVSFVTDAATGANLRGNRDMEYDNLDRLTRVSSPMFGHASYEYDALNNLTRIKFDKSINDRDHYLCYSPSSNQLQTVRSGSCAGQIEARYDYDSRGNLNLRSPDSGPNGVLFDFDHANRLRGVEGQVHAFYDGHGRRVFDSLPNTSFSGRTSFYDKIGKLISISDDRQDLTTFHFYLGSTLVSVEEHSHQGGAITVKYQHTDALGSPVAVTDSNRNIVERSEFEPYGAVVNRPLRDGVGYTGHLEDESTGLVYMQQRYYDPMIGRFISIDPVAADRFTGGNDNRYWYAANNPYKYVDPDGQFVDFFADLPYLAYDTGRFLGASAAAGVGALTGNDGLRDAGLEGMAETGMDLGVTVAATIGPGVPAAIARPAAKAARSAGPSIDDLSRAASTPDRNGFTRAGRNLQKRNDRESVFSGAGNNPANLNRQAQFIVDDILTSPGTTSVNRHHARFGDITEMRAPDGRGVRFSRDGQFINFLDPPP